MFSEMISVLKELKHTHHHILYGTNALQSDIICFYGNGTNYCPGQGIPINQLPGLDTRETGWGFSIKMLQISRV